MEPREAGGVLVQQRFTGKHNYCWFNKNSNFYVYYKWQIMQT